MTSAEKKALSEHDICTKFIMPALVGAHLLDSTLHHAASNCIWIESYCLWG